MKTIYLRLICVSLPWLLCYLPCHAQTNGMILVEPSKAGIIAVAAKTLRAYKIYQVAKY